MPLGRRKGSSFFTSCSLASFWEESWAVAETLPLQKLMPLGPGVSPPRVGHHPQEPLCPPGPHGHSIWLPEATKCATEECFLYLFVLLNCIGVWTLNSFLCFADCSPVRITSFHNFVFPESSSFGKIIMKKTKKTPLYFS